MLGLCCIQDRGATYRSVTVYGLNNLQLDNLKLCETAWLRRWKARIKRFQMSLKNFIRPANVHVLSLYIGRKNWAGVWTNRMYLICIHHTREPSTWRSPIRPITLLVEN